MVSREEIMSRGGVVAEMMASSARMQEATQRMLEISAELHLTWYEFESAVDAVKKRAYISTSSGNVPVRTS